MALQVGDTAPNFSAVDQNGQLHSLENYAGQNVVLYFYPKDDTPGCAQEACSFRDAYAELKQHAVLLGVSADSKQSHQEFAAKYDLPFPLLVDEDRQIITAYGADGLVFAHRVSFLIDKKRKIVKIYDPVDVNTHSHEVLQDLQALS